MKDFLNLISKKNNFLINQDAVKITKSDDYYLIHLVDKDSNIEIEIDEGVNANIFEIMYFNNKAAVNKVINCKKNSSLNIITLNHSICDDVVISAETNVFENAYLNSMKMSIFLGTTTEKNLSSLVKPKSKTDEYNVLINASNKKQLFDLCTKHLINDTESHMVNIAICKNESSIFVDTNGVVIRGAKRSNVTQKTKGLLLSKQSEISANPLLQIDEFDCLASHGAGIGTLDQEDLFYLMSRGLTQLESEKLIISGFMNPIYAALDIFSGNDKKNTIRSSVEQLVSRYL